MPTSRLEAFSDGVFAIAATLLVPRRLRFVIGAPLYGLSVGLALVSAPACLAVNGLLAVYYAAPGAGALDLPTGDARD